MVKELIEELKKISRQFIGKDDIFIFHSRVDDLKMTISVMKDIINRIENHLTQPFPLIYPENSFVQYIYPTTGYSIIKHHEKVIGCIGHFEIKFVIINRIKYELVNAIRTLEPVHITITENQTIRIRNLTGEDIYTPYTDYTGHVCLYPKDILNRLKEGFGLYVIEDILNSLCTINPDYITNTNPNNMAFPYLPIFKDILPAIEWANNKKDLEPLRKYIVSNKNSEESKDIVL